jgi:hypothetical protein
MKPKALIWLGLCIQCLFLILWLFRTPEVSGLLRRTREELQRGDAHLAALTVQNPDSTKTTAVYDPSKSPSENLVARTIVALSIANGGYQTIVQIPPVLVLVNVVLSFGLLWLLRTKSTTVSL